MSNPTDSEETAAKSEQPSKTSEYGITIEHVQTADDFEEWDFDEDKEAFDRWSEFNNLIDETLDKIKSSSDERVTTAQRNAAATALNDFATEAMFGVSAGEGVNEGDVDLSAFDGQVVLRFNLPEMMLYEAKTIMAQNFRNEWVRVLRKLADDIAALPPPEE